MPKTLAISVATKSDFFDIVERAATAGRGHPGDGGGKKPAARHDGDPSNGSISAPVQSRLRDTRTHKIPG